LPALPISGVYELRNTITGNAYVGSGKDVLNRKASHFWQLRSRRHKNRLIQADFDKYGADSFHFELLQHADHADLRLIEQRHIDSGAFSYNLAPKAAGGGPVKSPDTIAKMRRAHTGKRHSPETIEKIRNRPAEKTGAFIGFFLTPAGRYPSGYQAEQAMGGVVNFTTIRRWCQNPNKVINRKSYGKSRYLQAMGEAVIGRTYLDLGFGFEPAKS
jgi:group I intron endonuclease